MDKEKVLDIFRKSNAMLVGHFLLTSGRHSNIYLEKFMVLQNPKYTSVLCGEIAGHFKKYNIDVVIGAAVGGIVMAYETARHLKARAIFMEREGGKLKLRRNFNIQEGENVLVVEDIVTTGGSVKELIKSVKNDYKGNITGVGLLIDRSGGKADFGVEDTYALAKLDIKTYAPSACPMCKKNTPLTKRGSRHLKK